MIIIPSIDLYNKKVTRLKKGDFNAMTTYLDSPEAVLKSFVDAAATLVHIVDLEGAKVGHPVHQEQLVRWAKEMTIPLQVGGGIRSAIEAKKYLDQGIARVVLGSLVFTDFNAVKELITAYPGQIVIALDVSGDTVMQDGWQTSSHTSIESVIHRLNEFDDVRLLVTDIATDGMLEGPNVELYTRLTTLTDHPVIASGGLTTCQDITSLKASHVESAIIGRAMHEGKLPLKEAIRCSHAE